MSNIGECRHCGETVWGPCDCGGSACPGMYHKTEAGNPTHYCKDGTKAS